MIVDILMAKQLSDYLMDIVIFHRIRKKYVEVVIMSMFLFGDGYVSESNCINIPLIKAYAKKSDVLYWFNDEISAKVGSSDINSMLRDNCRDNLSTTFFVTTKLQCYNSEDLLSPFEKYSHNQLFPSDNEREAFEQLCRENLEIFIKTFKYFIDKLQPVRLRVFTTSGYECNFLTKHCSIDEMFETISTQISNSAEIDSTVYEIGT
jgi:hypothetical protein